MIHKWLLRHPRFHLHFTPTSASWLNQVERWFAEITNRRIRRGSYRSTRELVQTIEDYLAVHNEDPKPFVWTKSADDILESLKKYCEIITDTGHSSLFRRQTAELAGCGGRRRYVARGVGLAITRRALCDARERCGRTAAARSRTNEWAIRPTTTCPSRPVTARLGRA